MISSSLDVFSSLICDFLLVGKDACESVVLELVSIARCGARLSATPASRSLGAGQGSEQARIQSPCLPASLLPSETCEREEAAKLELGDPRGRVVLGRGGAGSCRGTRVAICPLVPQSAFLFAPPCLRVRIRLL